MKRHVLRPSAGLLAGAFLASAPFAMQSSSGDVEAMPPPQSAPPGETSRDVGPRIRRGEPLPAEAVGPSRIVDVGELMRLQEADPPVWDGYIHRARNGEQGSWIVPTVRTAGAAHSGTKSIINKWGDTRMGIGFPGDVDVDGAWFASQTSPEVTTDGVQVVGYRDGREVARTEWFEGLTTEPRWFEMDLDDVDRIELISRPRVRGGGWYALDDLTFRLEESESDEPTVVDFEDLPYKATLTGTDYAGLAWETGTGDFDVEIVPAPRTPDADEAERAPSGGTHALGGSGTAPTLAQSFEGARLGDPGAGFVPPDTCGAAGLNHFVEVVNTNLSVYVKSTGARVVNISLNTLFGVGGIAGDPRVAFDPHSNRFFILATNFSDRIYLAVSTTSDPTGSFFTTQFIVRSGSDSSNSPDYPTLGVDANGVYTSAFMFGGTFTMSIFALDKAPLIAAVPSLGTVTAFRGLPYAAAIQPCVTYGTPAGAYMVGIHDSNELRAYRVNPPLNSPTLTNLGTVVVPSFSTPPDTPAQGSAVPLDSVDERLMNAVYRNGSIWAAHSVNVNGRAAVRWYEIDAAGLNTLQIGTIDHPSLGFTMPTIAVNQRGDAILGFSGSNSQTFGSAYYSGRLDSDPASQTSPPTLYKAGEASYQIVDGAGRNRWGDYSLTSVDPADDLTFWTAQEYAESPDNNWGTWIARLEYDVCTTSNYCTSNPNSLTSGAVMDSNGNTSISANNFEIRAIGAAQNKNGIFFYGPAAVQVAFGDGFQCVGAGGVGIFRLNPLLQTDVFGNVSRNVNFTTHPAGSGPGQITAGSTWRFQFWFRDPQGPGGSGFNLTDGLAATFCP